MRERDRQTDRHRQTQTDTDRQTDRHRQTDRQTHGDRDITNVGIIYCFRVQRYSDRVCVKKEAPENLQY